MLRPRRRWLPAVVAVLSLGVGWSGPPAGAQDAPVGPAPSALTVPAVGAPGSTSRIELVAASTRDGWSYVQLRNRAYPCAIGGYSTFTIATRVGTPADAVRPLWVYMHGGGFGHFDAAGEKQPPDSWNMHEEDADRQIRYLTRGHSTDGGIMAAVRADPAAYRMLGVSMCGHDGYGGPDVPDPNNPHLTPDGRPRTVNGLYATKAAIAFALRFAPTDDLVVHGTSAGSFGAWHVAWALDEQGLAPTAVVADSGIFADAFTGWADGQPGCGDPDAEGTQIFRRRLHPAIVDPANRPALLVAEGRLSSPVLDVWTPRDPVWCGDRPIRCPVDDGPDVELGANACLHEGVRRAIAAQGPGSRSRSMALCVDDPATVGDCDQHAPADSDRGVNTDPAHPRDFRGAIMDWARHRLGDDGSAPVADRTPAHSFATAAVADLLGRTDLRRAEAVALALAAGDTKTAVLGRLTRGPEWLSAIVQDLYRSTLGREGTAADVAFWVGELASGRRTVARAAASFYASAEHYGAVGGTPEAWVGDLYDAILGRPADPGGVAYWVDQVARTDRPSVAHRFFQSAESVAARVGGLYERLLARTPSASDVAYWGPRVKAEGDLALAVSLGRSGEYQKRAEARFP